MRKSFTAKFKMKLVLEIFKEEKTISQIASENGVHPNQLSSWKKDVLTGLPELLADHRRKDNEKEELRRQIQELYAQLGETTSQLSWLKKKSGIDPEQR